MADRRGNGKFLKGHGIKSKGNPNVRRLAELQAAVRDCATADDVRKVLISMRDAALSGDTKAAQVWLPRVLGREPSEPAPAIAIDVPDVLTGKACLDVAGQVLAAVRDGVLAGDQAQRVLAGLDVARRCVETADIEQRVEKLERRL